jgi:hypothetical protein
MGVRPRDRRPPTPLFVLRIPPGYEFFCVLVLEWWQFSDCAPDRAFDIAVFFCFSSSSVVAAVPLFLPLAGLCWLLWLLSVCLFDVAMFPPLGVFLGRLFLFVGKGVSGVVREYVPRRVVL